MLVAGQGYTAFAAFQQQGLAASIAQQQNRAGTILHSQAVSDTQQLLAAGAGLTLPVHVADMPLSTILPAGTFQTRSS
jgi:hypothetical protein